MTSKLIGSTLLIVGTTIGAGMLALPIATAQLGFINSVLLLMACWFVMTAGALLILEVNLWLPQNSNLISMAKATIGPVGQGIAWVTYLLLLYSLLCAYIAGGSDLFHHLLATYGVSLAQWQSVIIFVVLFGGVVYGGIHVVDHTNRVLMFVKFGAFFLLIALLAPHVNVDQLIAHAMTPLTSTALTVTMTSFGFASIIPSLRIYFAGDVKRLKLAIFIGSLIPLFLYIAWDAVIMGIIPLQGDHGLMAILHADNSTSTLVKTLTSQVTAQSIEMSTKIFTSICVLTSFLGVALCLTDFLSDGLKIEKVGINKLFIHLITFIPPVMIVIYMPNAFIKALEYAGIYCVVLLVLLPAWMAWCGRYRANLSGAYRVMGGKIVLVLLMLFSIIMIINSVIGA